MNPSFLKKLQALQQQRMSDVKDAPHGMSMSNLKVNHTNNTNFSKVLVIPPGLGKQKVNQFSQLGSVKADGINNDYPEESIKEFVSTVNMLKPKVVVAGSRGTALVREMLKKTNTYVPKYVILFGPVHLRDFFKSSQGKQVKILVVHGTKDDNEKITTVRSLVQEYNAKLVELEDQKHSLNINENDIRTIVKYWS